MKKIHPVFLLLILPFFLAAAEPDYSRKASWFLCETEKTSALYDLFYVYPTLSGKKDRILLDPADEKIMKKITDFVRAQTGIFGTDARVFAPFVRQVEYPALVVSMKKTLMPFSGIPHFSVGLNDVKRAFEYYRRHFRNGRPFIFLGHSQGAMELYELLRQDREISQSGGFVAAYLLGLPGVRTAQMQEDFRGRGIAPAQSAEDLGAVIVWNTRNAEAKNDVFVGEGVFCINPLNWKTTSDPASAQENRGAVFYDYRTGRTERRPAFCGARVDPAKGALIVDLPSGSKWDAHGFMGRGVFHMNDIWFFAENLRENARLRAEKFLKKTHPAPAPAR